MTQGGFKWLIRLFPGRWKDRYGQEFLELLDVESLSAAAMFDIFKTLMLEWIVTLSAPRSYVMLAGPKQMITLFTKPKQRAAVVDVVDRAIDRHRLYRHDGWPTSGGQRRRRAYLSA